MNITASYGYNPAPTYTVPLASLNSLSLPNFNLDGGLLTSAPPGSTTYSEAWNLPLKLSAVWVADKTLPADPAPAVARFSETSSVSYEATGAVSAGAGAGASIACSGAASDGFSADLLVLNNSVYTSSGTHVTQYAPASGSVAPWTRTLSASAVAAVTAPTGGGIDVVIKADLNSYSVSAVPIPVTLTVDQDQQILAPAATTRFSATISNASGFTIDSVNISVDGVAATATVNPNNANNYFINWTQTGGNPSEHTVTATAQIHDSIGAITLNSTDPANRTYAPSGMGRAADVIVAALQLQSFQFNSPISLSKNDGTAVPVPQTVWDSNSNNIANYSAAYLKGSTPSFTFNLFPLTGSGVTMGFRLSLTATPNTSDPALVLYNNNSNATPEVFTGPAATRAATASLYPYVAAYSPYMANLNFYLQFKSTGRWVPANQGAFNPGYLNNLYALYNTPDAPMGSPWVGVLANACTWARGDSTAAAVSAGLTKGLFFSERFAYPVNTASHWLDPLSGLFMLSKLLGSPTPQSGNCLDVSDYLLMCNNSVGVPFVVNQFTYTYNPQPGGTFASNPLCLIGSDPTVDGNYTISHWAWHQNASPLGSSSVYDVCAAQKLDLSGAGYRNPPIAWPLTGYWQTSPNLGVVAMPSPDQPVLQSGPNIPGVE